LTLTERAESAPVTVAFNPTGVSATAGDGTVVNTASIASGSKDIFPPEQAVSDATKREQASIAADIRKRADRMRGKPTVISTLLPSPDFSFA
jgi:hypothetical protein